MSAACTVGEEAEDARAGQHLGEDDLNGTPGDSDPLAARICANGPTTKGIDVSYYQGTIDWARVKSDGIEFAFIRVSDGEVFRDPKFSSNWTNAKAAGVIRGAYQFFRPAQNVAMQADIMIKAVGTYQPGDLPPVIDVEADGGLAPATVASKVREWVDLVKTGTGVAPIIYTGKYFWRDEVGGPRTFETNALWIAQYTSKCPDLPSPWTRWTFWQHSDRGRVAGITGNVDLDNFNGTAEQLRAYAMAGATAGASTRAAALPFYSERDSAASYRFIARPPAGVTRVEVRVDDYMVGGGAPVAGSITIDHTFTEQRDARSIELRGFDAAGAVIAVGNGLLDSTPLPEVFVDQYGDMTYDIGTEDSTAATIEVTADGFPLFDKISGKSRSTTGILRYTFTQPGERELLITTRDATGNIITMSKRMLLVR
jgi:GH25 family lysozyme M1 (1,4-beta-N-acetylmuramidase)